MQWLNMNPLCNISYWTNGFNKNTTVYNFMRGERESDKPDVVMKYYPYYQELSKQHFIYLVKCYTRFTRGYSHFKVNALINILLNDRKAAQKWYEIYCDNKIVKLKS